MDPTHVVYSVKLGPTSRAMGSTPSATRSSATCAPRLCACRARRISRSARTPPTPSASRAPSARPASRWPASALSAPTSCALPATTRPRPTHHGPRPSAWTGVATTDSTRSTAGASRASSPATASTATASTTPRAAGYAHPATHRSCCRDSALMVMGSAGCHTYVTTSLRRRIRLVVLLLQ
jgi:hypothetical protein